MATTFFPTDLTLDAAFTGGSTLYRLLQITSRGASLLTSDATATAAGPAEVPYLYGGVARHFVTKPLNAVTISGNMTANVWGQESATTANCSAEVRVTVVDDAGTLLSSFGVGASTTEYGTARAARNFTFAAFPSTSIAAGNRLKVQIFFTDVGGTMTSAKTSTHSYNGTTGAADGDTFVTFTETITEQAGAAVVSPPKPRVVLQAVQRASSW